MKPNSYLVYLSHDGIRSPKSEAIEAKAGVEYLWRKELCSRKVIERGGVIAEAYGEERR